MHQFRLSLRLALAGMLVSGLSACAVPHSVDAQAPAIQPADSQPAAEPVAPAAAPAAMAAPAVSSSVAELQSLMQGRKVNELRTTYNGSYGASLLFKPDDLSYYVALFQQRDFWRVFKTASSRQAEAAYRAFAAQSAELAELDLNRTRLQAENARAEQQLADYGNRLAALQADQVLRRQQEQQIQVHQEQMRGEAQSLGIQQQQMREQLNSVQRQIDALQAEQDRFSASRAYSQPRRATGARKPPAKPQPPVSQPAAPVEPVVAAPVDAPSATPQ
jgi:hypothetical protein